MLKKYVNNVSASCRAQSLPHDLSCPHHDKQLSWEQNTRLWTPAHDCRQTTEPFLQNKKLGLLWGGLSECECAYHECYRTQSTCMKFFGSTARLWNSPCNADRSGRFLSLPKCTVHDLLLIQLPVLGMEKNGTYKMSSIT